MKNFNEFVTVKSMQTKKELRTLKKVLENQGMSVQEFLEDDDPYIFLKTNGSNLSFDGVRIYKIGDIMAYRIQKQNNTHPYGQAYSLPVQEIFDTFLSEKGSEEKAGKEVMKAIAEEFKSFFDKSSKAEKELRGSIVMTQNDPMGRIVVQTTGTDYANMVHSRDK